jgi:hypothetical protein
MSATTHFESLPRFHLRAAPKKRKGPVTADQPIPNIPTMYSQPTARDELPQAWHADLGLPVDASTAGGDL